MCANNATSINHKSYKRLFVRKVADVVRRMLFLSLLLNRMEGAKHGASPLIG